MLIRNKAKLLIAAVLLLSGCSNNIESKGYQFDKDSASQIIPNKSSYSELVSKMGFPTVGSIYGEPKLFNQLHRAKPMTNPYLVDQNILEITLGNDHIVKSVRRYSMKDVQELQFDRRTTVLPGNEIGALEQFLGNVGKYNNASGIGKAGA